MLTEDQKRMLISMIENGETVPADYRRLLFATDNAEYVERTGVYSLEYKGKAREQDILADTPAAPLQEIRSFNADNPHPKADWRNLLIYGDNLLALKALYEDQRGANRFGTRDQIKLIYIDPPFATKQDFMKDGETAYRDKLFGAQFIEFLRRRLVLLREILADDGVIFVHLDWKKSHYIKAVMDEIFGEENFRNELYWYYYNKMPDARKSIFPRSTDSLLFYAKNSTGGYFFKSLTEMREKPVEQLVRQKVDGKMINARDANGNIMYQTRNVRIVDNVWRIRLIPPADDRENTGYPTQKPEELLARVLDAAMPDDGIVLDAFMGSGTTVAVAEKMGRRWIGIDCGRLAIYTTQKRLLSLTTQIGGERKDERREHERVEDIAAHSKSGSKVALLLFDRAAAGELEITDTFLTDFAGFLKQYASPKKGKVLEVSLLCPKEKLSLKRLRAVVNEEVSAGQCAVDVGGVRFLISFVEPKVKFDAAKPLKVRHFALVNAGVYDRAKIRQLDWASYKPFVMQLFGAREDPHRIHAFLADGYIGTDSVHVWNFPDQKSLALDEGYVRSLHEVMRGLAGDRFYIVAPVSALEFMTDELRFGSTRYVVLKVPESVLARLLEAKVPGALRQPMSEGDVNAVIDAVGFDFVSQPLTEQQFLALPPENADLTTQHLLEAVVRLTTFRAKTMTTSPEDFTNFATLSMVMVDPHFDGDVFSFRRVMWAEDLVATELKRLQSNVLGDHATRCAVCQRLDIRIPMEELGERAMVILVDQYGNEKRLEIHRSEFGDATSVPSQRQNKRVSSKTIAKTAIGNLTKKATLSATKPVAKTVVVKKPERTMSRSKKPAAKLVGANFSQRQKRK